MNATTKQLLRRWQALDTGDSLGRLKSLARALWIFGLLLSMFLAYAVAERFNSILIAAAAIATGWTVAEVNALRVRASQWPVFRTYIDWNRVRADLSDGASTDQQ